MATCPRCKQEMSAMAVVCPHCGYDFPPQEKPIRRQGFAYSPLADIALIIGQLAALLACFGVIVSMIKMLASGRWLEAGAGIILLLLLLAIYVAYQRVQDLN